jgi:hypothetical protein
VASPDDVPDGMRSSSRDPFALDDDLVDALLDGRLEPDDAPPAFRSVATVLRAADGPARADEVEGRPDAIRRIFEEARRFPVPVPSPGPAEGRRPVGRWSARAAVVAIAAVLTAGGGVAMAATGTLPGPLQSATSRALEVVGLSVPDGGAEEPAPPSGPSDSPTSAGSVPPTTGAPTPTVPPTTTPAPTTSGPVSPGPPASDPTTTEVPGGVPGLGDEVCDVASDGRCRAGEDHPSDSRPTRPEDVGPPTTQQNPGVTAPGRPTDSPSATRPAPGGRP